MNQIKDEILKKHTTAILNNLTEYAIIFNKEQPEVKNMFDTAVASHDVNPDNLLQLYAGFMLAYFCIDDMMSGNGIDELERLVKIN